MNEAETSEGIDPIAKAFLHAINSSKGPQNLRALGQGGAPSSTMFRSKTWKTPRADIEARRLPGGSKREVSIRIVRPKRARAVAREGALSPRRLGARQLKQFF